MSFLNASIEWFLGKRAGHMGPYQYAAHSGMRNGRNMSGAFLWADSELGHCNAQGNMINAETTLLQQAIHEINDYVPHGTAVADLGPGTATAFTNKTLPLAQRLGSKNCVLVDESIAFLKQICETPAANILNITPIVDDFLENGTPYVQAPTLVCSFGSTISNCIGLISDEEPLTAVSQGLANMAHAANSGWLLVAFDSDHNGERVKAFYKSQELFQLNIFDRMAAQFQIQGDFDPAAFAYEPQWCEKSGQLAHMAVATRDMQFAIDGQTIKLTRGKKLHIKNSYKLSAEFFEKCCAAANLKVIRKWSDDTPAKIYLLRIMPQPAVLPLPKQTTLLKSA